MSSKQSVDKGKGRESWRMDEALKVLSNIVFDHAKRRVLLELRDGDAQSMIDYLYMLSSSAEFLTLATPKLRQHIFILLRKLCQNSMIYPTCYILDGIEDIVPKAGGGFCDIYQGRHQGNNLCLKVVRSYKKQDQHEVLKAFAGEAILWGQLEHSNITPFYGIFYLKESYERICLLSPWMENGNIVDYLKKEPQVPRRPFVSLRRPIPIATNETVKLHDIASGLEYLHSENIVHADLKGANVLIDQFSKARLTDFGLSKTLTNGTLGFTNSTNISFGRTTNWASPELLEENACHTPESDIWAFGCVCYEVLTGLFPFHGISERLVVLNLTRKKLPARPNIDKLDSDASVNRKIWQLVVQCWSPKVTQRPKCHEILQIMEKDAMTWQPRGGGPNNDVVVRPQFQPTARTLEDPSFDHGRARQLLEDVMGAFSENKEATQEEATLKTGEEATLNFGGSQSSGPSVLPSRDDQRSFNIHTMFPRLRLSRFFPPTSRSGSTERSFIVDSNTDTNVSDQFMKGLQERTILGVQSDSPGRNPPPRCHPGTRLALLDMCLSFVHNCDGQCKMLWVYGTPGVGKSAVMQSVAESPELSVSHHASIFFSGDVNNDGTKVVMTLCYQFAAKSTPYRRLIEKEIKRDPSLFQSPMEKQFQKLIVKPFIDDPQLTSAGRALVILDALEECNNWRKQRELLRLISDCCIKYPSSPIVWLITSRYNHFIDNFFFNPEVMPSYQPEHMVIDSDDARADVQRFLRDKLTEIKKTSGLLGSQWPEERDFRKLANASGGFFAHAHAVIRYISPLYGNPVSRFSNILKVIDKQPLTGVPRWDHPMAFLDELYARILSKVNPRLTIWIRKILLALASNWDHLGYATESFIVLANWLGMTRREVYDASAPLFPIFDTPIYSKAHQVNLQPSHESFIDYVSDFSRSELFRKSDHEQLKTECTFRILQEAPDGISFGNVNYGAYYGTLVRGPGTGDKISITWSSSEQEMDWDDNETRMRMYKLATAEVVAGMKRGDPTFRSEFCVRLLTTRFRSYSDRFPYNEFRDFALDEVRRHDFTKNGILKQMSFGDVDMSRNICDLDIRVQFRGSVMRKSDSWSASCRHEREGVLRKGDQEDWSTTFRRRECSFCSERFDNHLKSWKPLSSEHSVPVLLTSTGECCLEISLVDPEDGVSIWIYWVWIKISSEVRKKYGGPV